MSVDTAVPGDPTALRATATWLRSTLYTALDSTLTDLDHARDHGAEAWSGTAADSYTTRVQDLRDVTSGLTGRTTTFAGLVDAHADAVDSAQRTATTLRATAVDAGLTVNGTTVLSTTESGQVATAPAGQDPEAVYQEIADAMAAARAGVARTQAALESCLAAVQDINAFDWGVTLTQFYNDFFVIGGIKGLQIDTGALGKYAAEWGRGFKVSIGIGLIGMAYDVTHADNKGQTAIADATGLIASNVTAYFVAGATTAAVNAALGAETGAGLGLIGGPAGVFVGAAVGAAVGVGATVLTAKLLGLAGSW